MALADFSKSYCVTTEADVRYYSLLRRNNFPLTFKSLFCVFMWMESSQFWLNLPIVFNFNSINQSSRALINYGCHYLSYWRSLGFLQVQIVTLS